MIFNRTYKCKTNLSKDAIVDKLKGKTFQVHDLNFEVMEKGDMMKIIPHAENSKGLKTLPITHLKIDSGTHSTITIKSKPRRIDAGGPYVLMLFCLFLFVIGLGFMILDPDSFQISIVMTAVSVLIFGIFWFRMQMGYFDYIRKIKAYVKTNTN